MFASCCVTHASVAYPVSVGIVGLSVKSFQLPENVVIPAIAVFKSVVVA